MLIFLFFDYFFFLANYSWSDNIVKFFLAKTVTIGNDQNVTLTAIVKNVSQTDLTVTSITPSEKKHNTSLLVTGIA